METRFETYLVAVNVKDNAQKRALLLYQAGEATQVIFDTLPETGEDDDYKTAIEKLDEYFSPKKNVDYEIFQFRQAKQNSDETTDQFATRLRKLASHCEFHDVDHEIKSAVIQNCRSKHLRRYALRQDKLTLKDLLSKARALENSEQQAKGIEERLASTNIRDDEFEANLVNRPRPSGQQCRNCGLSWPHRDSPCPAKGQTCRKCNKQNHYARVCRSSVPLSRRPLIQDRDLRVEIILIHRIFNRLGIKKFIIPIPLVAAAKMSIYIHVLTLKQQKCLQPKSK